MNIILWYLVFLTFYETKGERFNMFKLPEKIQWKTNISTFTNAELAIVPFQKCLHIYGRVGIVVYVDQPGLEMFSQTISNLKCYARARDYDLYLLIHENFDNDKICGKYSSIMFRRHCVVATQILPNNDWVLFLDADNVIANPNRCVEEFIDPRYDILHLERFYNGEIQAGNYIAKNSKFSEKYLLDWAGYHSFHGGHPRNKDNGALHVHFLKYILKAEELSTMPCFNLWSWAEKYTSFISCFQTVLNGTRVFDRIKIYRRGHGPVRDASNTNSQWCTEDFILHGYKEMLYHTGIFPLYKRKLSEEDCDNYNWKIPYRGRQFVSISTIRERLIYINEYYNTKYLKHSAGLNGDEETPKCWPYCPENL